MKKHFFLEHNCFCEVGKSTAAIYDTNRKKLFDIDAEMGNYLLDLDAGVPIDDVIGNVSDSKKAEIFDYMNDLANNKLGFFSEKPVFINKLKPSWSLEQAYSYTDSLPLQMLLIELTDKCNLKCLHCIDDFDNPSRCSCYSNPSKSVQESVSMTLLKKTVKEAKTLGCNEILVMGGEPLLSKEKLIEFILHAKEEKIERITVKTNLYLLSQEMVDFFKNQNVAVSSSFYSFEQKAFENITGVPGSWSKWLESCKKIIANNIEIDVTIEVMKTNQEQIEKSQQFLKEIGVKKVSTIYVLSEQESVKPDKYCYYLSKTTDNLCGISKHQYFYNKERHSCWYGKIAVNCEGYVLPCLLARKWTIGNIANDSLLDLFREKKIDEYWTLSKDKIEICKDCGYRYSCMDCRPIETNDGTLTGGNRFCNIMQPKNSRVSEK